MSKKLFEIWRQEIKAAEEKKKEKKERDFNVNVSNVNVKVRVILFNERL